MCDFPARQLVRHAYKHTRVTKSYSGADWTYASGLIKSMTELGRWHEDLTGCSCFQEALTELGLGEEKLQTAAIAAIPTTYAGVNFRSRLEARYAAFFDLVGWTWQYEPFDLKGWTPDFEVIIPCKFCGRHRLLVEVKPYSSLNQFKNTPEYMLAINGYGGETGADAVALFGQHPGVSYWEMRHDGGGGIEEISNWTHNWGVEWKEAGNIVQWHKAEPPVAGPKKPPTTVRHCLLCYKTIPLDSGDYCDTCRRSWKVR